MATPTDPTTHDSAGHARPTGVALAAALADRYRVQRELGSGGMATVWLAEDVRHHRHVAIKVLHPELSAVLGTERFLKEIELTAALQHPHILPLFDSGSVDGRLFYVMPYVEGQTLRARLERERQLPVADAIRIASEVAGGLAFAHARGVVHRDIKPENILLQGGHAVVADFGIALAVQQAAGERITQTGLSLGTPQYMAPEQAMGERTIDARADVYALGAVLYEMLAGEPPFTGPTAQAIVARVMTERPRPLGELRDTVPDALEDVVHTALAKLPADRFASAGELAGALAAVGTGATHTTPARGRGRRRTTAARAASIAAVGLLGFVAGWVVRAATSGSRAVEQPERRAAQPLSSSFDARDADIFASADGRLLAFTDAGRVLVRRLDRMDAVTVPNAIVGAGSGLPFLSGDGSRIGFINGRDLVVQRLDGSEPTTVAGAGLAGAAFLDDARVVGVDTVGLSIIRLDGGGREVIARSALGTRFLQPIVLPGARHVLFSAAPGDLSASRILAIDLASRRVDTLALGPALRPQYTDGWLFFARPSGVLYAAPFDPRSVRVRGDPVPTGEQSVVARQGRVAFAAGPGVIALAGRARTRIVAVARDGARTVLLDTPGAHHNPRISPNGRQLLVDVTAEGGSRDQWIFDLASRGLTRVTSIGDAHDGVWTPDGRRITYLSFATRGGPIVTVAADGTPGESLITVSGDEVNPGQWLPDGSAYLAGVNAGENNSDLVAISADGGRRVPFTTSRYDEHSPALSPDGRWLAYVTDETGRRQLYVRSMHGEGRTLVSEASGEEPVWSRDGRQLLYVEHLGDSTRVLAARLADDSPPRVLARDVVLGYVRYEPVGNHANWDVMPDGRMIFVEPVATQALTMIFDWRPRVASPR